MHDSEIHSPGEHELKFVFENRAAPFFVQWLQCRCRPDPQFPEGIVSSIYYDTRDWRYLHEKVNSDYLKTKIRMRWYADIETGEPGEPSYLEAKYRIGSKRVKVRIKTGRSGKWLSRAPLSDPALRELPGLLRQQGVEIRGDLLPVFRITYNRCRFIEPISGGRICLDYDIRTPFVNWQMVPRVDPFSLETAVFEIKGRSNQLPNVLHQLTSMGCRKRSFSKYLVCYKNLMRAAL
ncbi:VTC domain-containing protein [Acidobacteriota bacterium]